MNEVESEDKGMSETKEFLQDKKSIIWVGGKPYASETYYCLTENLEIIVATVKENAYKHLKEDENVIIMNVSTFKKLQQRLMLEEINK